MALPRHFHGSECDRARASASHALDAASAELDLVALRAHLRSCAECAEVVAAMEDVTHRLRGAPALKPSRTLQPAREPAVVRRRRRGGRSAYRLIAVTATVAAAAAGAMVAPHAMSHRTTASHTIVVAERAPLDHQFRVIRAGQLQLRLPPPKVRSPHLRGVIV